MKYLLVVVLALAVFWLWQHNRKVEKQAAQKAPPRRQLPAVEIVECRVCGIHLPLSEAVSDPRGSYCCDAHRLQHGD